MCTLQCREALCVLLHSLERHSVCTRQSRVALFVYCTVKGGTVCVLHSGEKYCVCILQCRGALFVYCTV